MNSRVIHSLEKRKDEQKASAAAIKTAASMPKSSIVKNTNVSETVICILCRENSIPILEPRTIVTAARTRNRAWATTSSWRPAAERMQTKPPHTITEIMSGRLSFFFEKVGTIWARCGRLIP